MEIEATIILAFVLFVALIAIRRKKRKENKSKGTETETELEIDEVLTPTKVMNAGFFEETITVTEGTSSTAYGYLKTNSASPIAGSVSPTTFRGYTINDAFYDTSLDPDYFFFSLQSGSIIDQDFIYSVTPEGGNELYVESGMLGYAWDDNANDDYTYWSWYDPKPANWDGSGTSTVLVKYKP